MRRLMPAILAVSAALTCAGAGDASAAGVAQAAGSWRRAIEVPGLAALNTGGRAGVNSVSCGSSGNCVASGDFRRGSGDPGFVADERNGVWGTAIEVPGLRALGGNAGVSEVSCVSPGNCAAGGTYAARHSGFYEGFVADERNGTWGAAIEVPGLGALNTGVNAEVTALSCASAGNCAVGGAYFDSHGHDQGFVADERNGTWGTAIEVPGLGGLNAGGSAGVSSVSCGSAGNCSAGGSYRDRHGHVQGYVAVEQNGVWGSAMGVPGLQALNTRGYALVNSVSCAAARYCAAGGLYYVGSGKAQGFVVAERHGIWGKAIEVPGLGALNKGMFAEVNSVSCASAGGCAAGGGYEARHGRRQGFVVAERNGVWGRAIEVPGLGALNTGGNAFVFSVSCGSPGTCAAGGGYANRRGQQGFVAVERNGRWAKAIGVPGLGALNTGGSAAVFSVSCAPAGSCAAGGGYADRSRFQGFVVSQTG